MNNRVTTNGGFYRETDQLVSASMTFSNELDANDDYIFSSLKEKLHLFVIEDEGNLNWELDHTSLKIERVHGDMNDYRRNFFTYRMTAMAWVPFHDPLVRRLVDLRAFKTGASIVTGQGNWAVIEDGVVMVPDAMERPLTSSWWDIRDALPIRVMWEPENDMSYDEINEADYHPVTGIPQRVMVAMEDNIAKPLADGAL